MAGFAQWEPEFWRLKGVESALHETLFSLVTSHGFRVLTSVTIQAFSVGKLKEKGPKSV